MKTTLQLLTILSTSLLFLCCEEGDTKPKQETAGYEILSQACGTIKPSDTLGRNFYEAIDSLEVIVQPFISGGCPDESPCYDDYYVKNDTLQVDFSEDDREFIHVLFVNSENDMLIVGNNVLDTRGYHYYIHWCPD